MNAERAYEVVLLARNGSQKPGEIPEAPWMRLKQFWEDRNLVSEQKKLHNEISQGLRKRA